MTPATNVSQGGDVVSLVLVHKLLDINANVSQSQNIALNPDWGRDSSS